MQIKVYKEYNSMHLKVDFNFTVEFSEGELPPGIYSGVNVDSNILYSLGIKLQLAEEFIYKNFYDEEQFAAFLADFLWGKMYAAKIPENFCNKARKEIIATGTKYNWQKVKTFNAKIHTSPIVVTTHKSIKIEHSLDIAKETESLPGVQTKVIPACSCFAGAVYLKSGIVKKEPVAKKTVWELIQHYNDRHKWSREEIADWLDGLHEAGKINIEF